MRFGGPIRDFRGVATNPLVFWKSGAVTDEFSTLCLKNSQKKISKNFADLVSVLETRPKHRFKQSDPPVEASIRPYLAA